MITKNTLKNGMKVLYNKKDSDTVVIQILVKVGSNYESKNNTGICHFIEHTLFETKTRTARQVSAEIEQLGGVQNAFTGKNVTAYFVHLPKKHFDKGLEILADMIQNPTFKDKFVETERAIILNEAKMWKDDPKLYQWILSDQILFKGHPTAVSTLGEIEVLKKISRKNIVDFYEQHYSPENMTITIVGNVDDAFNKLENAFKDFNRKYKRVELENADLKNKQQSVHEKRDVEHSYFILGYKIPRREEKESYTFDVIENILGYGISSRLADEIRQKRGLAYQVGIRTDMDKDHGGFYVFLSTEKKNIEECKKIILKEFEKLQNLTEKELEQAKISIEGSFIVKNEDPINCATEINYWDNIKDISLFEDYTKNVKRVSLNDIKDITKKYLNENYTLIVIGK